MSQPNRAAKKAAQGARKKLKGFTDEERDAMRERAREMKEGEVGGEAALLAKIAEMSEPDRGMAKRVHEIIKSSAPTLSPRTWYGMPAYANEAGNVVCHFQPAQKFKMRYATLGFSDKASLDEGVMWPVAFALKGLTAKEEARIRELLKEAVG